MAQASPTLVTPGIKALIGGALLFSGGNMHVQAVPLAELTLRIDTTQPVKDHYLTAQPLVETRAPATSYKGALRKGRVMWAMINDPRKTKQAVWSTPDISKWGWTIKSDQNAEVFNDKTSGLEEALECLQISSGTSLTVRLEHNKDVDVDGIDYPATNAEYCGVYNPAKGVIIASDRHSPSYRKATSSHLSKSPLPQLQYWSDLTFLSWQLLSAGKIEQRSPLRYIFVRGITNRATQQLITDAMLADGYKHKGAVLPWPHFWMFTPNDKVGKVSDTFLAVLGTENFAGVAPLLAQHREVFGRKVIRSIRIWGDGGNSPVLHGMVELH